jgi:tetratricopeptide (TPR) repeat protein
MVTDLDLSPDGSRLATACEDGKLRLFDAATGELLLALDEQGGPGAALAFLPDGRLALGLANGRLRVLDRRADPELRAAHRAGRRTLAAAHAVLAPLFEELVQPAEVARHLRADDALDPAVREAALALAARVPSSAQQLEEECREVVRSPFAPDGALLEVSWKARLAATRDPDDEAATGLLGMALFRLGRHQQALEALERADRLRIETRRARPEVTAFLAMAHERLGHREQAEAQLERLRGLMSISALQTSRDAVALLAEAERVVGR